MIKSLHLLNAGPFKGSHEIHLGPKAYAITARYESDPGLSNKGGKSFLLEMIDFAITGRFAKFRRYDADGWITRGEREAEAKVVFEDGSSILRERRRGQPTQVRFAAPDRGKGAAQDEASAAVLEYLAFDADDFRNVAYFEQKQMARLVLTEPEKRLDIVRGWFNLGKAEAAEDHAGETANTWAEALTKLRARRELVKDTHADYPPFDFEQADRELVAALDKLRAIDAEYRSSSEQARTIEKDRELVDEYEELILKGKELAEEVKSLPLVELQDKAAGTKAKWETKNGAYTAATRETSSKRRVSLGQFDGVCPVATIACPAKKEINDDREASKAAYDLARTDEAAKLEQLTSAQRQMNDAKREWESARAKHDALEDMRAKATALVERVRAARKRLKTAPVIPNADELEHRRREANEARDQIVGSITWAKAARETHAKLTTQLLELDLEIEQKQRQFAIANRGRGILRATQRRVAEQALGAINRQASAMLADGGIDLSVELRWEREGKGLAKQCEECGAAFPPSAKVKTCATCGAERGQLMVQRLEFLPSDRSGAADDIAGVVLQLAAGSWFLRSRSSPWATAMLDEPLSACDRTNRRALSMQLVKLLATGTWRQALIISHNPDTVELYPGRIEVIVGRDGSRRIVQS